MLVTLIILVEDGEGGRSLLGRRTGPLHTDVVGSGMCECASESAHVAGGCSVQGTTKTT